MAQSVEIEIAKFVAKYTPALAVEINAARKRMQARIPRGYEMVNDNYNALVFSYGPSERLSEAQLSIAAMPRWVSLCFIQGANLEDPKELLHGEGSHVRSVRLTGGAADLDRDDISALIDRAMVPCGMAFASAPELTTVIRSVSAKQRDRRPREG